MKLQVTQENLARALNTVARVASTRGTLPILSNVLFKIVSNRLCISATNLDIAITHFVGAKVSEEGAITVPAKLTQDFISSLPSDIIELKLEDNKLHISSGKYQSAINGVSAEDFPVMPAIDEGKSWSIPAKTLKKGLGQVIIAASSDEARPVLTGVYLHSFEGKLYAVATDSYRLAEKELMPIKQEMDLLIPASAMQDLLRVVNDFDGNVEITHNEQQVLFQVGDVELVTRLIEGKYPDYRKLIPSSFATTATLPHDELLNITKVSSLFARESAGSITINVDEAEQQVSIHSIASQLGENTAAASGEVTGSGNITLNSRYLLDALHVLSEESVTFSFNGKLEASILRASDKPDYTHVIMPLKS